MAYNLPPPWQSGYALPKNVEDEGLERRAFVTKQMPRGTYDNPDVGTGGYAVPQYIRDEGYGQGTFTTKWQPRGTYNPPAVPAWLNKRPQVVAERPLPTGGRQVTIRALAGMGGTDSTAFANYGDKTATAILSRVASVAPNVRGTVLRRILDAIDKSLWKRTMDIRGQLIRQGLSQEDALHLALARAMSAGMAAEIYDMGARRSSPQPSALHGLGYCNPRGARVGLGIVTAADREKEGHGPTAGGVIPVTIKTGSGQEITQQITPKSIDGKFDAYGMVFDLGKPPRVWNKYPDRRESNQVARDQPPDWMVDDPAQIPPELRDFLYRRLTATDGGKPLPSSVVDSYASPSGAGSFPQWDASTWFRALGIEGDTPQYNKMLSALSSGLYPFGVVTLPDGQERYLRIMLRRKDYSRPDNVDDNPLALMAWITAPAPDERSLIGKILDTALIRIPLKLWTPIIKPVAEVTRPVFEAAQDIHDAITDAVKDVIDNGCKLLATPGVGQVAGAAVGTVTGVGPAAGAVAGNMGAAIARDKCGNPLPDQPPLPPPPSKVPWLIAGGVAVGILALLASQGD